MMQRDRSGPHSRRYHYCHTATCHVRFPFLIAANLLWKSSTLTAVIKKSAYVPWPARARRRSVAILNEFVADYRQLANWMDLSRTSLHTCAVLANNP